MPGRRVVLVCGPPCAGKSRYVEEHAAPGDVVVCVDRYAREAGSPVSHNHAGRFYRAGEDRFWRTCNRLARAPHAVAWVVRCAPDAGQRADVARLVRASQVLLLVPPYGLALRRARRRDVEFGDTCKAIDSWYRRYTPGRPGMEVVLCPT